MANMVRHAVALAGILCSLSVELTTQSRAEDGISQDVTYAKDIAPILFEHCAACHHPGGIGPFSLLSYQAARDRAALIADATGRRFMPPWKPVPGYGTFRGERRLTSGQIDLIRRWADTGALEGHAVDIPESPSVSDGWQNGEPDLVVTLKEAYPLPAGSNDVYRNFTLSIPLDKRRWVKAAELNPGASNVIHHARIMLDSTGRARELEAEDPTPGYDGFMLDSARFPPGHFLGWAPGKGPTVQPDSLSWALDPGTDLVLQLHLLPDVKPVSVKPEVGLFFSETPASLAPISLLLTSKTIDIPAGEASYVVQDRYRLPVAVDVLAIYPHAHYLGKEIHAVATLLDGTERSLLRIDDWDFNWQDEYRYVEPVHLPEGALLEMRFIYDNSSENPRNPHDPPLPVRFGPKSTDEMAELMLQVLTSNSGDQQTLLQNLEIKKARDNILALQAIRRRDPNNHVNRTGLAALYLSVGQVESAFNELQDVLRLAPDFPEAHYNLGLALVALNKFDEAIVAFQRAVVLKPDYADAHNNLGGLFEGKGNQRDAIVHFRLAVRFNPRHAAAHSNLAGTLLNQGKIDEAVLHYRNAIANTSDDPAAHNNLARALLSQGEWADAIDHYQRALARAPNLATSLVGLAWLLATAPAADLRNASEAVALAERALSLVANPPPTVLDTLAAAYAADGRFDRAVATAREAASLARDTPGFEQLALQIDRRVQLYLSFAPYRLAR